MSTRPSLPNRGILVPAGPIEARRYDVLNEETGCWRGAVYFDESGNEHDISHERGIERMRAGLEVYGVGGNRRPA